MGWLADIRQLEKEFFKFDFFQLNTFLRYIQKEAKKDSVNLEISYRAMWRQVFSASDIVKFNFSESTHTILIEVAFFSLGGSSGPLPQPYIEYILDQARLGNDAPTQFFDIFHHKLLEILLDVQEKYSLNIPSFDTKKDAEYTFLDYLSYLTGIGSCADAKSLDWLTYFPISQFPILNNSSAKSLRDFIYNIFHEEPEIKELIGYWREIPTIDRNILGKKNTTLGQGLYLGRKAWINNSSIHITIDVRLQMFAKFQCKNVDFIKKFLELIRIYSNDRDLNITLVFYITDFENSDIILSSQGVDTKSVHLSNKTPLSQNNVLGINTYFKDQNHVCMLRYVSRLLI